MESRPADIHFYFDPVDGWAWLTSKWVRRVASLRGYTVEWRFVSLLLAHRAIHAEAQVPAAYSGARDAGLRLLRVAAAVREHEGPGPIGPLYEALTAAIFDVDPPPDLDEFWHSFVGSPLHMESALAVVGVDPIYSHAADDSRWDGLIAAESREILASTGPDIGTPIIRFRPPDGPVFFGPVISRVPASDAEALRLWDAVTALAAFTGFSELKRSLRPTQDLRILGSGDEHAAHAVKRQRRNRRLKTPTEVGAVVDEPDQSTL